MTGDRGSVWLPASPCGPHCVHTAVPTVPRWRSRLRIVLFGIVGIVLLAVGATTTCLPRAVRHDYWRRAARIGLRSLGATLVVDDRRAPGRRQVRGALVVANHISFLDIIALAGVVPARFVAKREVVQMAGFGPIARFFGVLSHHRGDLRRLRPFVERVAAILDRGRPVAVFPEGTTWCGTASGRFRPAFFQAAVDSGVPILPMRLTYTDSGGRTTMPGFLGDDTVATTLERIAASRHLTINVTVFDLLMPAGDRRELAAHAEELIVPVCSASELRESVVDLGAGVDLAVGAC